MAVPSRSAQKRGYVSRPEPEEPNKRVKVVDRVEAAVLKLPISTPPVPASTTLILPMADTTATCSLEEMASAPSSCSPYGPAYHISTVMGNTHLVPPPQLRRCGLRIGSVSFEDVQIFVPPSLNLHEQQILKDRWQQELQFQEDNPPALPASRVAPLPPKQTLPDYMDVPEGASDADKERVRQYNNDIASQSQKIDRERNNQAAKKSRETRLEALHNTRQMLNDKAAECGWLRLKLIQLGGDPLEWDAMDGLLRKRMVEKVAERVTVSDQFLAEEKKKEEQKKRADRAKAKMEAKETGKGICSPEPLGHI